MAKISVRELKAAKARSDFKRAGGTVVQCAPGTATYAGGATFAVRGARSQRDSRLGVSVKKAQEREPERMDLHTSRAHMFLQQKYKI